MSLETDRNAVKAGAWLGLGVGVVAVLELVAVHRRLHTPGELASSAFLWFAAFAPAGAIAAAIYAFFGARFFRLLRGRPEDGARVFAVLAAGYFFWPRGLELAVAGWLFLARSVRRRAMPRHSRLDGLFALLAFAAAVFVVLDRLPLALPASSRLAAEPGGVPVPGSISVTITVRSAPEFPAFPAVHPTMRELASSPHGVLAALWSGRAPARTPAGQGESRKLLGGAPLAWSPDRPLTKFLLRRVSHPLRADDPLTRDRPLERLATAAHVPLLRALPDESDPALCLRIFEMNRAPTLEEAERLVNAGAWIDVRLAGPNSKESLSLAGEGVRLAPAREPASLLDVTPTALHLLGLAVPRDVDGRVLLELLDPSGPGGRAPRYRSRGAVRPRARKASIAST